MKLLQAPMACMILQSLPVRGAWVEIERCAMALRYSAVAPRAGSVG